MKGVDAIIHAQVGAGHSVEGLLNGPKTTQSLWGELSPILLVLGAALVVGLLLFLVVYWWKRDPGGETLSASATGSGPRHHRGKRRKRLRVHRPRNPTLAETGGLPPLRDEGPPSSKP